MAVIIDRWSVPLAVTGPLRTRYSQGYGSSVALTGHLLVLGPVMTAISVH